MWVSLSPLGRRAPPPPLGDGRRVDREVHIYVYICMYTYTCIYVYVYVCICMWVPLPLLHSCTVAAAPLLSGHSGSSSSSTSSSSSSRHTARWHHMYATTAPVAKMKIHMPTTATCREAANVAKLPPTPPRTQVINTGDTYICMYMYVCIYVCMYTYIYIYIFTNTSSSRL